MKQSFFRKNFNKYFIVVVLLCASFLRLWQLDSIPSGLHPDEADTGYSAYSILNTGITQYGTFNLLGLQELSGGTHPPLYTYSLIPLIKFFGLSIFIERLPSVIFGILSVLLIYLITDKLFKKTQISNISALIMAFNPWAIHLSRQGLLESISIFFILFGIYLFLLGNKYKKFYLASAIIFGLSLFSYDAPKVFLPLFLPALIFYKRKELMKSKKSLIIFSLIFITFYSVILRNFIVMDNKDYGWVSVFNKSEIENTVNREITQTTGPLFISKLFHNKVTTSLDHFLYSYSTVFSINWLFLNGQGNVQESVAKHGEYILLDGLFFFLGLYFVFKNKKNEAIFLLSWLLIGAVPGGITSGNYAYRSSLLLPSPIIITAFGIFSFFQYLKKLPRFKFRLLKALVIVAYSIFILSYLYTYFFDYPVYSSDWWYKERNQALAYVKQHKMSYGNVFVDGDWINNYAFNNLIDPFVFQKAFTKNTYYKTIKTVKLDNIYFGSFSQIIDKDTIPSEFFPKNSLLLTNNEIFKDTKAIRTYHDASGNIIFRLLEIK